MTPRTNWQYGHWIAVDDDTHYDAGDPIGMGKTEQEAIEDLQEQLAEREERIAARPQRDENFGEIQAEDMARVFGSASK